MDRSASSRRGVVSGLIALLALGVLVPAPAAGATGPYLVRDIDTSGSSSPLELTALNDMLLFSAKGGGKGRELWRSDGTADGTRRVRDIRVGGGGSHPWNLAAAGGLVYFSAGDGINGRELWASDGTASGTRLVKDINPGTGDSTPFSFHEFNGVVFFSADDGTTGRELWRTNGTATGTWRVKNINAGADGSNPNSFVELNEWLYFFRESCIDSVCTETLFRTDGSGAGTAPVRDGNGDKVSGEMSWLTLAGPRLFFIRDEVELWRSGATASTTRRIASMNAWELEAVGSRVFFRSGEELWKSDGTAATTSFVADFTNSGVNAPQELNGRLFFFAFSEPWISDGTSAGTQSLGVNLQADTGYAELGAVLYFGGFQTDPSATEAGDLEPSIVPAPTLTLWRSDGTQAGTYSVGPPDAHMHSPTTVGAGVFFVADAGGYGSELWRYVP